MTTPPKELRFTADAFLDWAAEQTLRARRRRGRGDGTGAGRHARVKLAAVNALAASLSARNLPCEAMIDGIGARIDDLTVYVPDVLVRCGARIPDDVMAISDPVVVVEVVSPSSRAVDSGAKLTGYFRLASVRHYLVVNVDARAVTHHRRGEAGDIATQIRRDGTPVLDPPGLALAVADFFAGL